MFNMSSIFTGRLKNINYFVNIIYFNKKFITAYNI